MMKTVMLVSVAVIALIAMMLTQCGVGRWLVGLWMALALAGAMALSVAIDRVQTAASTAPVPRDESLDATAYRLADEWARAIIENEGVAVWDDMALKPERSSSKYALPKSGCDPFSEEIELAEYGGDLDSHLFDAVKYLQARSLIALEPSEVDGKQVALVVVFKDAP